MKTELYHENIESRERRLIAEKDIQGTDDFREWLDALHETQPPPEGWQWLANHPDTGEMPRRNEDDLSKN